MARVVPVDAVVPSTVVIDDAARVVRAGGLVAMPTETVYGLAGLGLDAAAVRRIFDAKGRPATHPLILHVEGIEMARGLAASWPDVAARLAAAFWPGPLTLVVPRHACVPDEVTGGLPTVALRAPAHPVARALIRRLGEPLAAPSANAHTAVSPTTAEHVVRSLGERVDLVLDAGACLHGIESTVVGIGALADDPPLVLRPGALALERLREAAPNIRAAVATLASDAPRASPGMAAKHYAPRARVEVLTRGDLEGLRRARDAVIVATDAGRRAAVDARLVLVLPDDPAGFARGLYAALHEVDDARAGEVVVEGPPAETAAWWAVEDRLARAARR